VVSRTWPVALAFGAFAAYAPVALVRFRVRRRRNELRDLWPDAVDNLASAVRAGL
jgi:tight adherence protein B